MEKTRDQKGRFIQSSSLKHQIGLRVNDKVYGWLSDRASKNNVSVTEYARLFMEKAAEGEIDVEKLFRERIEN